MQQEQKDSIRL